MSDTARTWAFHNPYLALRRKQSGPKEWGDLRSSLLKTSAMRSTDVKSSQDIVRAVAAIGRIDPVPSLLKVLCDITGLRFAAVVRVTGTTWTACAVRDGLSLGIKPGGELTFMTRFGVDSRAVRMPIETEQAKPGHMPRGGSLRTINSFVSVPIIVGNGRHFGTLCAMDYLKQASVGEPRILSMFEEFAALIASGLEQQSIREREQTALLDERATNELREQFIAILGHDLRNPLQAVFASVQLLERRLTDPAQQLIVSRIQTHVRRMTLLIEDVLDFARGRLGGGIDVELADVENISNGLTTVIQELQAAQPDCKILSSIEVRRSVRCDLGRLQQVASNLLGNALTHGRPGSPVEIRAATDERDLVLEVWNAGEPIEPDSLVKIFEPFWRHSVSASRNGLGLGLHICSQIVLAHQGQIGVTSTAQHGTRFTVRLPLTESELLTTATFQDERQPMIQPPTAAASSPSISTSESWC
jgi:signal transduction histidine kinase